MQCNLNCYGEAATPVNLQPGGTGGITVSSIEDCRAYCLGATGCEAIVYGLNTCWGKKDVLTAHCQAGDGYVTEMLTRMPFGTCTIMGDPHVLPWDDAMGTQGAELTQLLAGEYYLVKSSELVVQARFGYSERFPNAASATGVAVQGSLTGGNLLICSYVGPAMGYQGFKVTWNGVDILNTGFPASFDSPDGFLSAKLDSMDPSQFHQKARHTIGGKEGNLPSFLFHLSPHIRVYVLIGDETVNIVLTMRRLPGGQDGYCGNFNCIAHDDTAEELAKRGLADAITNPADNLFASAPEPPSRQTVREGHRPRVNNCDEDKALFSKAQETCKNLESGMKDACVFDVCASSSAKSGALDAAAAALTVEVAGKFDLLGPLRFDLPFFGPVEISPPLKAGLVLFVLVSSLSGFAVGWSSRRNRQAYREVSLLDADGAAGTLLSQVAAGVSRRISAGGAASSPEEDRHLLDVHDADREGEEMLA